MKALLLATATLMVGLPVQADTVWLLMREYYTTGYAGGLDYVKIQVKDIESCEEQGAIFVSSERLIGGSSERNSERGFECLEGK